MADGLFSHFPFRLQAIRIDRRLFVFVQTSIIDDLEKFEVHLVLARFLDSLIIRGNSGESSTLNDIRSEIHPDVCQTETL